MRRANFDVGAVHFLVVEDSLPVALACQRTLVRLGKVTLADGVASAGRIVATTRLTGLVTDVSLPDGSGFSVAKDARDKAPGLPILIISGAVDHGRLEAAHELGAMYLLKPLQSGQLTMFGERAIARQRRAALLLQRWVVRYNLFAAEAVTLRMALDGLKREEIARVRGVSANTVKNQVSKLLPKLGVGDLAEAIAAFYQELSLLE
jgi:DNA-binding NarL/FixJ family response regulator